MHTRLPQQRCLLPSRLLARTQSQTNRMTRRKSRPAEAMTQRRTRRELQLGEPMGKQRTCIQNPALDGCEWLPHMQHRDTMGPNSVPHGPVALRSMRHSTGLTPIWRSCMRERGGSKVSSDETDSTVQHSGKRAHACVWVTPACMHACTGAWTSYSPENSRGWHMPRSDQAMLQPDVRRGKKKKKRPLPPIRINLSNCKYEVCKSRLRPPWRTWDKQA